MTTADHREAPQERDFHVLGQAAEALNEVQARIGPRFRRSEARSRARRFLEGSAFPDRTQEWLAVGRGAGRARSSWGSAEALRS